MQIISINKTQNMQSYLTDFKIKTIIRQYYLKKNA